MHVTQLSLNAVAALVKTVAKTVVKDNRSVCRGGGRNTRLVRPFEKNLNLTIIGPTRTENTRR